MAEQLNPKLNEQSNTINSSTVDNVDLDQLFNFLSGEVPDSIVSGSIRSSSITGSSETPEKTSILDEIDRQMTDLQNEIDRYSITKEGGGSSETSGTPTSNGMPPPPSATENTVDGTREPSPPPLPPPSGSAMQLGKPSLPEPEGPPPPPPVQNGYAFNTPHIAQEVRNPLQAQQNQQNGGKPKEPIYESIKPRPEPLGGTGEECGQEYGFGVNNGNNIPAAIKPPAVPKNNTGGSEYHSSRLKPLQPQNGNGNGLYSHYGSNKQQPPMMQQQQQIYQQQQAPDPDREARRVLRVQRQLDRIQEAEEEKENEEHFSMLEFAENFFNDHEKSPQGTIVGTLKRSKTMELLAKSDMISFYKGPSIPNSHIHLFDPENVNIACNIFKELNKYAKGELKDEASEVGVIQTIIGYGLDREELRDEIYVQCSRQITGNPSQDQADRIWLLLCLIVVAFPPGKSFFKVKSNCLISRKIRKNLGIFFSIL